MRIIKIVTLAQILSWVFFVFGDYISETFSTDIVLMAALLFMHVIIPVVYLVFQKRIDYKTIPKWVNTLTALFVWVIENFIFAWLVRVLDIVPQSHGQWEDMLNGIEYDLFPLFNIAAALMIVIFWNLVLFVSRKLKEGLS